MIYVLEIYPPLGSERHKARFYLGYCKPGNLKKRLWTHRAGYGAAITRYAAQHGHHLSLVVAAPGTPDDEKRFKRWKNHRKVVSYLRKHHETC